MTQLDYRKRTCCRDCGLDVTATGHWYMVLDEVWAATGLGPGDGDGVLCLGDLARRLGRPLRREDFMPTTPENCAAWDWRDRMYPQAWPGAWIEQLVLPLALPEQRRTRDPVPEKLLASLRASHARKTT